MLVTGEKFIHIDSVIWQPQTQCKNNCSGCYIKNSNTLSNQSFDLKKSREFIELLKDKDKFSCDQLVISLDSINYGEENLPLANVLIELWELFKNKDIKEDLLHLPDLCVTVRDFNTVEIWARLLKIPVEYFLKPIQTLALSSFPFLGKQCENIQNLCRQTHTQLIYNKVVSGPEVAEDRSFEMGVRYSDMVYLVVYKPILGQPTTPNAFNWWLKAKEKIPQQKLIEDVCLQEITRIANSITTTSCSAGLNRICIWPNGTVTGCPYDSNHNSIHGVGVDLFEEIKLTIEVYDNQQKYPICSCKLSDLIFPKVIQEKINGIHNIL